LFLIIDSIAGGAFGWYFYKGLKSGVAATRSGKFVRSERVGLYWAAMAYLGFWVLATMLAFVFLLSNII
jgi:hypothetical protein